jgi:hypothetical protein
LGEPRFSRVRRVVSPFWGLQFQPRGRSNQNRGPAEIDPRRTGIVCTQRHMVKGEVGKQRKTFVGAGPTPSCFQVQRELGRLECKNHDGDCRNNEARYVQARRSPDRRVEEHTRRSIRTEAQSEEDGKDECDEEPRGTALHGASSARACCKLRSLFISANSRKQDCSSCQAATPSRVAASASLGT